jgi:hypothetical protein
MNMLKARILSTSAIPTIATLLLLGAAVSARAADRKGAPPPAAVASPAPPGTLPGPGVGSAGIPAPPPSIDPTTGLPLPAQSWKDPDWQEPDKRLPELSYDGVPVGAVADDLRKKFNEAFDVLIPTTWHAPAGLSSTIDDLSSVPVRIQLRNVTASEVFNAMNIIFESENTPLRWELRMNGKRPTAILRVLADSGTFYRSQVPQPIRKVIFVGDMVDERVGGMTMEELVKTISEIYQMSYGTTRDAIASHLQFHKPAQLLIMTGSIDEINFVTETLSALRQKGSWSAQWRPEASPDPKSGQNTNTSKPKNP